MDANAPTAPRKLSANEKRRKALDYRIGGKTFQAIGDLLGISRQGAHSLVEKALLDLSAEIDTDAKRLRELETARLDFAQNAIWSQIIKGDLGAVDRYLRISARRAALWGLDMPSIIDPRQLPDSVLLRAMGLLAGAQSKPDGEEQTP